MKICFFDSGIGGLSILDEVSKVLPSAELFYISDDAYAPYGNQSPKVIQQRCHQLTKILIAKKVNLIVVACNTATAWGIKELRQSYPTSFVGVEPYLNIVHHMKTPPAHGKIAVITTHQTGNSQKFLDLKKKADPDNLIFLHKSKNLAQLVELAFYKGMTEQINAEIKAELEPLKPLNLSHLILGCTHYPLISSYIEQILDIECISPCSFIAQRVKNLLFTEQNTNNHKEQAIHFMSTKNNTWDKSLPSSDPRWAKFPQK